MLSLLEQNPCRFSSAHRTSRAASVLPTSARLSLVHRPNGVLTSGLTSNSQNFRGRHQEVAEDSEWYGPEAPDHATPPAAVAASTATVTNRADLRLMNSFTKYLKNHKLDLSVLFCAEPLLSADSAPMCDLTANHHSELLSEFLTSGNLRVGEQLPHWFVYGNVRGAIKTWLATRPAAEALGAAGGEAAAAEAAARAAALAAAGGPTAAAAAALVDPLLGAMPAWAPETVAELGGWEAGRPATAEDVGLLHAFGALVYGSRLDCGEFLRQLCGADPFTWVDAQVAGGAVAEPQPWLLESFFMSKHVEGEALPLWFATWGVREEVAGWLAGPKAAALVEKLLSARAGGGGSVAARS